mmetsp:Transcript_37829/g.36254  ORF Transcript_37829/g.36254 Transcript_37829/m.36254 type:complete len:136 (+) Transcript_37829:484-891(+)
MHLEDITVAAVVRELFIGHWDARMAHLLFEVGAFVEGDITLARVLGCVEVWQEHFLLALVEDFIRSRDRAVTSALGTVGKIMREVILPVRVLREVPPSDVCKASGLLPAEGLVAIVVDSQRLTLLVSRSHLLWLL